MVAETQVARVTGLCSVVGGAAWSAACFVHNALPQGCIGDSCADRTMRGSSPADEVLFAVAGLMLAASGVGLIALTRRRGRGRDAVGVSAMIAGGAGLALLFAAGMVSTVVDNDWSGMPGLVVPGIGLLVVGLVLVVVVVLRARVLPVWTATLLLATVLLLAFANEQTSRILFAVPFGLVWFGTGMMSLRRLDESREDVTPAAAHTSNWP